MSQALIKNNSIWIRISQQRLLVLLMFALATMSGSLYLVLNVQPLEIEYVSVDGQLDEQQLTQQQRNEVLTLLSSLSLTNGNIKFLRSRIESVSWVAETTVERKWPDTLLVKVVPEKAIALWNNDAFINDVGEVFHSDYEHGQHLAQLYGPVGSEREVMRQYQLVNNALLKVGRSIQALRLDSRGAWILTNDLGIEVLLGRDELMERIQRLILIAEHVDLMGRLDEIERIDTRYANGVAVSWKHATEGMELAKTFKLQREQKL